MDMIGARLQVMLHSFLSAKRKGSWHHPIVSNPYNAFWYVWKGSFYLQTDQDTILCKEGDALLLPLHQPYTLYGAENTPIARILSTRFSLLNEWGQDWFLLYRLPYDLERNTGYGRKLLQIQHLLKYPDGLHRMQAEGKFADLLSDLLLRHLHTVTARSGSWDKQEQLVELLRWIKHHLHEPLNLSLLAGQVHMSTDALTAMFKDKTETTPMKYVTHMRIEEAKRLLLHYDYSIQQVSERVGYDNALYFSKVFSRIVGVSPSAFRKTVRRI